MREILDGATVLARVIGGHWPDGLAFHSKDEEFVQAGTWRYPAGKELLAHKHLEAPRTADITQEVVFVARDPPTAGLEHQAGLAQAVDGVPSPERDVEEDDGGPLRRQRILQRPGAMQTEARDADPGKDMRDQAADVGVVVDDHAIVPTSGDRGQGGHFSTDQ